MQNLLCLSKTHVRLSHHHLLSCLNFRLTKFTSYVHPINKSDLIPNVPISLSACSITVLYHLFLGWSWWLPISTQQLEDLIGSWHILTSRLLHSAMPCHAAPIPSLFPFLPSSQHTLWTLWAHQAAVGPFVLTVLLECSLCTTSSSISGQFIPQVSV